MEFANIEISAVQEITNKVDELVVELSELELALIGGGTGDIHFGR